MKTIMAEINVSEGRNMDTIEAIKEAVLKDNKVTMVTTTEVYSLLRVQLKIL